MKPACMLEKKPHSSLPFIHHSANIYMDNFDPFVLIVCSNQCQVAYHKPCWSRVKREERKKIGKGVNLSCVTPDCPGQVVKEEEH